MAIAITTQDKFQASMTLTTEGARIYSYDNYGEIGVQIERANGQIVCLLGTRELWDLTGFIACCYADAEDDYPSKRVLFSLDELLAALDSNDYTRILQAIPLTSDEQVLLHEVMESL